MESFPLEILLSEIVPRIDNPLDVSQLRSTCKHFNQAISAKLLPAWLLDERLPD
jgi:hypothetical protein